LVCEAIDLRKLTSITLDVKISCKLYHVKPHNGYGFFGTNRSCHLIIKMAALFKTRWGLLLEARRQLLLETK
jgi:hypothetical protein